MGTAWRRVAGIAVLPFLRLLTTFMLWLARRKGTQRDAHGLASLAWREIKGGRLTSGRILAEMAIAADPDHPEGYRMLAWAHDQAGDLEAALRACEHGLVVAPANS